MENPGFKLPKSFLTQLGEFTDGFMLITINDKGEFEVFQDLKTPVLRLGMLHFLDIFVDQLQDGLGETSKNDTTDDGLNKSVDD